MSITIVSPTGAKISKVPTHMRPEISIYFSLNPKIKDFSYNERLAITENFLKNYNEFDFLDLLGKDELVFFRKMLANDTFKNTEDSLELASHIFGKSSAMEKIRSDYNFTDSPRIKVKKANNDQRPTLKFTPENEHEKNKNKRKLKYGM